MELGPEEFLRVTLSEHFPRSGLVASKEILEAIGLVAAWWSRLEKAIEDAIHLVGQLQIHLVSDCLTADMGVTQRLDTLLSLSEIVLRFDSTLIGEIQAINKDIRKGREGELPLQTQRNQIVHSYYSRLGPGDDSRVASASTRTRGGRLKISVAPKDRAGMIEVARKIAEMDDRIDDWTKRVRLYLEAHPEAYVFP